MAIEPARDKSIESLSPSFRKKFDPFFKEAKEKYPNLEIFETRRSQVRQNWLYAKGRTSPGDIVTHTLQSNHKDGNAVDLVFIVNHSPTWQGPYQDVANIAKKHGIERGGDWKSRDMAHFENGKTPLTINQIIMQFYESTWKEQYSHLAKEDRIFQSPDLAFDRIKDLSELEKTKELIYLLACVVEKLKK